MHNPKQHSISFQEVLQARRVVSRFLRPTALTHYPGLSAVIGAQVYIKHENHQPTGVFKIRGGINLVNHLKENGWPGILTTPPGPERPTIGNSNGSILTAAKWLGLKSLVVVPDSTNPLKVKAFQAIGAEVFHGRRNPAGLPGCRRAVVQAVRILPRQHLRRTVVDQRSRHWLPGNYR